MTGMPAITITAWPSPAEATRAIIVAPSRIGTSGSWARSSAAATAIGSMTSRMPIEPPMQRPMDRGLYLAASGMLAEQLRQDQIANDLSNSSTSGYKAERTTQQSFGKLLLTNSVTGATIGSQSTGVQVTNTVTDWTPQALKDTGEPLDMAINGDGFFAVQTDDGVRYTRNGEFASDEQGRLVTTMGDPVLGRNNQPVKLGADGKVDPAQPQRRPAQQPREGRQQLHHRHARRRRRPGRGLGPRRRPRGLRRRSPTRPWWT